MGFCATLGVRAAFPALLSSLTLVLLPCSLAAADIATETPYTVGVARLEDRGLPSASSGFPASWSLLLVRLLSDLPPRLLDDGELAEIAGRKLATTRMEAGKIFFGRLDELAARELEPGLAPKKREELVDAASLKAEDARTALSDLISASLPGASTAVPRPTALWKEHAGGTLIDSSVSAAPDTARSQRLSLLVTGEAAPAPGGYISVSLSLWDAEKGQLVLERREFCNPADPDPSAMAEAIRRYVAGRPYARLEIAPTPKSSRVTIDGVELPENERIIYRFEDATLDLRAEAPGRVAASERIELIPGDRRRYVPALMTAPQYPVYLSSAPDGARIFIDGLPVGNAPLELVLGTGKSVIRAEAEGYEGERIVVDVPVGEPLVFSLVPADGEGSAGRLTRAKDTFYSSLGWFVLGMTANALVRGLDEGFASVAERAASTESLIAAAFTKAARITVLVSLGALLANAGWKLGIYMGAAR